jgi:hypothetical protein
MTGVTTYNAYELANAVHTMLATSISANNLVVTGALAANGSPASNLQTQVYTGVSAQTTSLLVSNVANTVPIADQGLQVTINEPGVYNIDAQIFYYASANAANGAAGVKFDLGGGTATVNAVNWSYLAYGTSLVSGAANISAVGAQTVATVATSAGAPSWVEISGAVVINAAGTFSPRWSQASSTANAVTRTSNSYLCMTKIG